MDSSVTNSEHQADQNGDGPQQDAVERRFRQRNVRPWNPTDFAKFSQCRLSDIGHAWLSSNPHLMIAYPFVVKVKICDYTDGYRESRRIHAERAAFAVGHARCCRLARRWLADPRGDWWRTTRTG